MILSQSQRETGTHQYVQFIFGIFEAEEKAPDKETHLPSMEGFESF
jgi:hypothetical protein